MKNLLLSLLLLVSACGKVVKKERTFIEAENIKGVYECDNGVHLSISKNHFNLLWTATKESVAGELKDSRNPVWGEFEKDGPKMFMLTVVDARKYLKLSEKAGAGWKPIERAKCRQTG